MRTRKPFRRPIALVVSTALLTGGLAGLAAPASAAPGAAPTVTGFSPDLWDNRSKVPFSIDGSDFLLNDASGSGLNDYVELIPVVPDAANEVAAINSEAMGYYGDFNPSPSPTNMRLSLPLTMVPPLPDGYRLVVHHATPDGRSSNVIEKRFYVYGFGPANASSVAFGANNGTSAGENRAIAGTAPLDITGTNFAVGAKVEFLTGPDLHVDAGLTFKQGNPGNTTAGGDGNPIATDSADGVTGTGYVSTSKLQGNYTPRVGTDGAPLFTPGLHQVRVTNVDNKTGGTTATFSQPYFVASGVSPTTIGVGSSNVTVTVTGQGIRSGSTLSIQDLGTAGNPVMPGCGDISVGASTVSAPDGNGTFTKISAPVSLVDCSASFTQTIARAVKVSGPDGAFWNVPGALGVAGAPTFDAIQGGFDVLGQGAKVGYDANGVYQPGGGVTITGTNFQGKDETDPAKMVSFDLGAGVTVTTRNVLSTGSAEVTIDVASNATVGERPAKVINPDGGSGIAPIPSNPLDPVPFEIQAGPQVSKVSPPSFQPSQAGTTVNVTGAFTSGRSYNLAVSNAPSGTINYPASATASSATALSFSMSTNGATPGLRDLTITDSTNRGRYVCTGCLGIDSLEVTKVDGSSGSSAPNNGAGPNTITFASVSPSGLGSVGAGSTVRLNRVVALSGQPAILGTGLAGAGTGLATATFDLRGAAPGQYSVTIVLDPNAATPTTWSCTGCLTVLSAPITTTSITPATGGQGAKNRELIIKGTNFARGMDVSIGGDVAVHHPVYVDRETFKVQVDIPTATVAGPQTVTVTNGDGGTGNTGSTTTNLSFEVTAAPVISTVSPTSAGQGAGFGPGQTVSVTLTGDNFSETAVPVFGDGVVVVAVTARSQGSPGTPPLIPATQDTLTATIKIAENATTGLRTVSVDNGDGGIGSQAEAFTVNPGPKVTNVASDTGQPVLRPDGVKHVGVSFLGAGFVTADGSKTTLTVTKPDGTADGKINVENVKVVSSSKITADVTVAQDATLGARTVAVTNPADKGYGTCTTCLVIANIPGSAGPLALQPGASSLTATWQTAAPNGTPVTTYRLAITKAGGTTTTVDADPAVRTYTFTGLTNGATYTVSVTPVNAAGLGPKASASAIPGLIAKLTAAQSVRIVTYGKTVTYSGKLTSGTAGVPNKAIRLAFYPAAGKAFVQTVATSSTGFWFYTHKPAVPTASFSRTSPYNLRVYASFTGDSTYRQTVAPGLATYVSPKVAKSSPASGARSSATTTLKITGSVGPKKPGKVVYLYRITTKGKVLLAKTTLSRYSTYTFAIKPAKGSYTLRVYIPASYINGRVVNTSAYSPSFVIYRT